MRVLSYRGLICVFVIMSLYFYLFVYINIYYLLKKIVLLNRFVALANIQDIPTTSVRN